MTNFDKLYNSFLSRVNEDVPVDLMPGIGVGAGERATVTFPEKANYSITPEQAANVIDDVIDYLVTRNNHSPLDYKNFQAFVIADKITGRTSLNPTKAKYAARVVHNAMIEAGFIKDERSKTTVGAVPTPEEVESVADTVSQETKDILTDIDTEEVSAYHKAKDFPPEVDDEALEAAWNALPDDVDIDWSDICKKIGKSNAESLINIGALVPVADSAEEVVDDESETPILDIDSDEDEDVADLDEITPSFKRTYSPYRDEE